MKKLVSYLTVSLILCIVQPGCDKGTPSLPIQIFVTGTVPQRYGTGADAFSLKVVSINDSRCPPQAQCGWQGYVQVKFTFSQSDKPLQEFSLCNGGCNTANIPTTYTLSYRGRNYKLSLIDVKPYQANSPASAQVNIGVQAQ